MNSKLNSVSFLAAAQRAVISGAFVASALLLPACGSPNKANIELRKQNQLLTDQVSALQRQHESDAASIAALQNGRTIQTLPQDRLDQLFTASGLKFGKLTGGNRSDPNLDYDDSLQVFVVPIDQQGQPLKAAGSFTVEAFDLSADGNPRIGTWSFPASDAAKNFYGTALLYTYILTCPWQTTPKHPKLTIKVTFTDSLTGREFTAQREATCAPPADSATQPRPTIAGAPAKPSAEAR